MTTTPTTTMTTTTTTSTTPQYYNIEQRTEELFWFIDGQKSEAETYLWGGAYGIMIHNAMVHIFIILIKDDRDEPRHQCVCVCVCVSP